MLLNETFYGNKLEISTNRKLKLVKTRFIFSFRHIFSLSIVSEKIIGQKKTHARTHETTIPKSEKAYEEEHG